MWSTIGSSAHARVPVLDDREHPIRILAPPTMGQKLALHSPAVAGGIGQSADGGDVDHTVAGHATVEHQVLRRYQPVAHVEGSDPAPGAGHLLLEIGVPPNVVHVYSDAQARALFV